MPKLTQLLPAPTDRAVFVGQTGSGKTTLAEYCCRSRPYVVVLDPKGRLQWLGYEIVTTLRAAIASKSPRVIYKPVYAELMDDAVIDGFFQWIYQRERTTVYVDELFAIAQGDQFPWHFGACLTRGRELGIEVWTATQRPSRIPGVVLSESEHLYAFKLKLPRDREKMEELSGLDRRQFAELPKRSFYYVRQDAAPVGPLTLHLTTAPRGS